MSDVVLHTPEWIEDNSRSDNNWIVFRCSACANNTVWIRRSEYDKGKLPSTAKHFPQ